MSEFITVGVTAMRDPVTGELLDSVPLYIEVAKGEEAPLPVINTAQFMKEISAKVRAMKEKAR